VDGKRLLQLRNRAGLTQVQLAVKAGVNVMVPSRIERGVVEDPPESTLRALARALEVTVDELLAEPGPEPGQAQAEPNGDTQPAGRAVS
jgi:transcriptional regulator with XRE-family HTH domain